MQTTRSLTPINKYDQVSNANFILIIAYVASANCFFSNEQHLCGKNPAYAHTHTCFSTWCVKLYTYSIEILIDMLIPFF